MRAAPPPPPSPRRPFAVLLLAVVLALLATTARAVSKPQCLRSADHNALNKILSDGGPGTRVVLCPDTTYRLTGTVVFTAADQEIATLGYPTDEHRAVLQVVHPEVMTAVQGDCRRCARVALRNIVVDGGRAHLGRAPPGAAAPPLIVLGGNEGQVIRECHIKDPRGWTAIHFREGSKLQCKGAVIERNEVGPVGDEYDPIIDGPDPELSPRGPPLADGISVACRDSVVRDNTVYDCTNTGIVLFCSPGTLVQGNTVATRTRSAMGGILMADAQPFDGDYSGVVVRDNRLEASGRAMRVGIGAGLSILSDDIDTFLRGGTVVNNGLTGRYMGFGIAAAGLEGWTIKDNWSKATHQGNKSPRCFDEPVNPEPMAFLAHKATLKECDVQSGFEDHDFAYIVCIDGLEKKKSAPHEHHPPPQIGKDPVNAGPEAAVVEKEVEEPEAEVEEDATGDDALDDILQHSQQRMMEHLEALGKRVELVLKSGGGSSKGEAGTPATLESQDAHGARLHALEAEHDTMHGTLMRLHDDLRALREQAFELNFREHELIESARDLLNGEWLLAPYEVVEDEHVSMPAVMPDTTHKATPGGGKAGGSGGWEWVLFPAVGVAMVLGLGWRYMRGRRGGHDKIV